MIKHFWVDPNILSETKTQPNNFKTCLAATYVTPLRSQHKNYSKLFKYYLSKLWCSFLLRKFGIFFLLCTNKTNTIILYYRILSYKIFYVKRWEYLPVLIARFRQYLSMRLVARFAVIASDSATASSACTTGQSGFAGWSKAWHPCDVTRPQYFPCFRTCAAGKRSWLEKPGTKKNFLNSQQIQIVLQSSSGITSRSTLSSL